MVVLQWEVVNIYFVKYNCWYSRGCKSGGHFHLFYHNFIPFYLVGWWSFCFVGTVSYRVINLFFVVPKSDGQSISFEYSSLVRKTCMQVVLPLSSSTQSISQFNNAYIKYSVDLNGCRPHCCKDHSTAFISRLMTRNNLRFLSRNHFHFLCQMLLYNPHSSPKWTQAIYFNSGLLIPSFSRTLIRALRY